MFWQKQEILNFKDDEAKHGSKIKMMKNRKTFTILLAISIIIYIQNQQKNNLKQSFIKEKTKKKSQKEQKNFKKQANINNLLKKNLASFKYLGLNIWGRNFIFSDILHTK